MVRKQLSYWLKEHANVCICEQIAKNYCQRNVSVIYVKIRWVLGKFCVLCFLVCKVYIIFADGFIVIYVFRDGTRSKQWFQARTAYSDSVQ